MVYLKLKDIYQFDSVVGPYSNMAVGLETSILSVGFHVCAHKSWSVESELVAFCKMNSNSMVFSNLVDCLSDMFIIKGWVHVLIAVVSSDKGCNSWFKDIFDNFYTSVLSLVLNLVNNMVNVWSMWMPMVPKVSVVSSWWNAHEKQK